MLWAILLVVMGKLQFESSSPQADLQSYFTRRLSPLCEDSSVIEQLYSEQLKSLEDIISRCVLNFESNSVLVMGPRGSGKSILMKTALERLSKKNNAKGKCLKSYAHLYHPLCYKELLFSSNFIHLGLDET